jgi:phage/conjugal plasmid C-4 type zinc finger TraR family protein
MTDIVDLANARAEELLNDALAARQRLAQAQAAQASATECERCAAAIPVQRRQAVPGVRLCVHCQASLERGFSR